MRRTFIAVLLVIGIALPMCAQRRSFSTGARGRVSVAVGSRRGGVRIGGGVSFGHNPRFSVFVGSRPRYRVRPYYGHYYGHYGRYPYPYAVYPIYAYPFYDTLDSYDYVATTPQPVIVAPPTYALTTPQPYYPYSADDSVGLDTQMRQQHVGIYATPQPPPAAQPAPAAPNALTAPQSEQPLTVLLYRDGRRAEVRNFAIVGQTLWIFSDERAQKVPLSDLDLNATRKANDARGVEFALPPTQ